MSTSQTSTTRMPQWLVMLLVSMSALMLEVSYTRIVSFKLFYFYVFLVIGLALLGIGSGGIAVAIWEPLKRATTERIVAVCCIWGAVSITIGYVVIARLPINTFDIWAYGTSRSFLNVGVLAVLCLALFATFISIGIIIATLLGRAREQIGRLYMADLVGAGAGAFFAIPFITWLSPPAVVMLSALILVVTGLLSLPRKPAAQQVRSPLFAVGSVTAGFLAVVVAFNGVLPDVRPEDNKIASPDGAIHSEWGPVFRVDVGAEVTDPMRPDVEVNMLAHDGTFGSALYEFDGDVDSLTRYDSDARSIPFTILDDPPERELIIGSAGGNEILASLYYGTEHIEAVELNPVTTSLLTDDFAEHTGNLPDRPEVDLHQGDGRTYLARTDKDYDLVWFVAPDSYAASNAASSGAFVLSESYLYTTEMIEETLEHLTDDGIMVAQFGELNFLDSPNRTARYVVTAREALQNLGVEDPSNHIVVSAELVETAGDLATIIVKRTPVTADEVERFTQSLENIDTSRAAAGLEQFSQHIPIYAPGLATGDHLVASLGGGTEAEVASIVADSPTAIHAVVDDAPFFWHFERFTSVIPDIFESIDGRGTVLDIELGIGERVLLLLFAFAALYAAIFLLLPFITVRRQWAALPFKPVSSVYFACLGLGFMFYEITMIQRLVLFLGFPTLSLTVTLAAILVFTGGGAILSNRFADRPRQIMPALVAALLGLTVFYQFGLPWLTSSFLTQELPVRIMLSLAVLAPLGVCLGMFMPLGLRLVSGLTRYDQEYVAWSWAVNGFFSVMGAVLTTILSMTFGFTPVLYLALAVYVVAVLTFLWLHPHAERIRAAEVNAEDADPAAISQPAPSPV
jgi:hypothetical protein